MKVKMYTMMSKHYFLWCATGTASCIFAASGVLGIGMAGWCVGVGIVTIFTGGGNTQ